ncbi:1,4-dihydroxy-2-naphthoate octaprenyltransferase [Virgibacillus doumboii]|uniref:1,4-dihydroxy-2-naphthoate octaprenyltransferase n=1 Tax=Virgibacillus doumboii TaxID=2697503 RepID=UPI0013E07271|nr:1,4-dihydroxy-2-naphthoate octaprenyltransferase [Virgibacillus doumboii]
MLNSAVNYHKEKYYYRASWLQLFRPLTLTGTISPILVGTGIAALTSSVRFDVLIALLIATLFIQIATNMFNDYYDFRNGQDEEKWTDDPSKALGPSHSIIPYVACFMLAAAMSIGIWIAFQSNFWIIPVGIFGIIFGYLYSAGPRPLCSIGLGETVAFVFLGLVTTILGYVVQGNAIDFQIIAVAFPFALLIASMILTNNIRDIKKDHTFRNTLATILGHRRAVILLTSLFTLAYLTVISLTLTRITPYSSLIILLALPWAIKLRWSFRQNAKRAEEIKGMKWAALHHWVFGLLFAAGIWIGVF